MKVDVRACFERVNPLEDLSKKEKHIDPELRHSLGVYGGSAEAEDYVHVQKDLGEAHLLNHKGPF